VSCVAVSTALIGSPDLQAPLNCLGRLATLRGNLNSDPLRQCHQSRLSRHMTARERTSIQPDAKHSALALSAGSR